MQKRTYEKAVKKSVSMPSMLFDKGVDRVRQIGYATFSDYIQMLIRQDLERQSNFKS